MLNFFNSLISHKKLERALYFPKIKYIYVYYLPIHTGIHTPRSLNYEIPGVFADWDSFVLE